MLEKLEKHLAPLNAVQSVPDALRALQGIVSDFGLRSGYVVEYAVDQNQGFQTIDTWPERARAGAQLVSRLGHSTALEGMDSMRDETRLLRFRPDDFSPDHPFLPFARDYDLLEFVGVPIDEGATSRGLVGFSGSIEANAGDEMALQLLSYRLFSQIRQTIFGAAAIEERARLTPRERQVMSLSATGLTSSEIAQQLGLSDRTVNQHVTNVTLKFGTRNRVHTIAELLRRRLLD